MKNDRLGRLSAKLEDMRLHAVNEPRGLSKVATHLIQEIHTAAQEMMKSEEIGKQLAGLYASELLQAFETGTIKPEKVSQTLADLHAQTALMGVWGSRNQNAAKGRSRAAGRGGIVREGVLFQEAMRRAYHGEALSWSEIFKVFPEDNPASLRTHKSWIRRQYQKLDEASGFTGYALLCDLNSGIYCREGVELMARDFTPLQVQMILGGKTEAEAHAIVPPGEYEFLDFAGPQSLDLVYLPDLASSAMKN